MPIHSKSHLEFIESAILIWNHRLHHVLDVNASFEQYYSAMIVSIVLKLKVLLRTVIQKMYMDDEWILDMR
jgi:hypothetical protein